jgi:hypothetical protein
LIILFFGGAALAWIIDGAQGRAAEKQKGI